jgi:hypothetical protein
VAATGDDPEEAMSEHTKKSPRAAVLIAIAATVLALAPASASAHEGRTQGDLEMVVGFGTEPAYAGQPNSVQLILVHDGEPVVDLGDTLDVEVSFGDETMVLPLEPNFAVGAFGEPGDYRAWFIPTRPGQYAFQFSGTVDGEEVDETFTSGPRTFSDVENPADIQFPVQDPSNGELAERIEQEVPRLTSAIDDVRAAVVASADDAAGARTLGLIGLVAGALALVVGIAALLIARRRTG